MKIKNKNKTMRCVSCGSYFKHTKFNQSNECEDCLDCLPTEYQDTELEVDIARLQNPSGKTPPVFYD